MDSLTKNKKTDWEITELLRSCPEIHGAVRSITELTKGSFNAVYQVELSGGGLCVLKIAPAASAPVLRNERHAMQAEVEALRRLRAQGLLPAPRVLRYSESGRCDSPFLIMQWMRGEDYQSVAARLPEETQREILTQLGAMTRTIHQIRGAAFGPLGGSGDLFPTWGEAFFALYRNLLQDGAAAQVSLPLAYDELYRLEERAHPFLSEVQTPCLIHGDLWMGNILVDHRKISALLDFERSLWGDPLMEYPFGLLRRNQEFLRGYRDPVWRAADLSVQIRRALYNLYHDLIVRIEMPYRGVGNPGACFFADQKIMARARHLERLLSGSTPGAL